MFSSFKSNFFFVIYYCQAFIWRCLVDNIKINFSFVWRYLWWILTFSMIVLTFQMLNLWRICKRCFFSPPIMTNGCNVTLEIFWNFYLKRHLSLFGRYASKISPSSLSPLLHTNMSWYLTPSSSNTLHIHAMRQSCFQQGATTPTFPMPSIYNFSPPSTPFTSKSPQPLP